jgi:hypothetical protein
MNGVVADEELPDVELPKPETGIKVRFPRGLQRDVVYLS